MSLVKLMIRNIEPSTEAVHKHGHREGEINTQLALSNQRSADDVGSRFGIYYFVES